MPQHLDAGDDAILTVWGAFDSMVASGAEIASATAAQDMGRIDWMIDAIHRLPLAFSINLRILDTLAWPSLP